MMSNKLTYKKVFVDSQYRLPQSKSSSDFVVELNENFECPAGTKCWITEVSMPTTWKTTENGFYEYLYVMVFDNSDVFVTNFRVYLGNKIYFASSHHAFQQDSQKKGRTIPILILIAQKNIVELPVTAVFGQLLRKLSAFGNERAWFPALFPFN